MAGSDAPMTAEVIEDTLFESISQFFVNYGWPSVALAVIVRLGE
jgi:hypothetical protein